VCKQTKHFLSKPKQPTFFPFFISSKLKIKKKQRAFETAAAEEENDGFRLDNESTMQKVDDKSCMWSNVSVLHVLYPLHSHNPSLSKAPPIR